MNRESTAFVVAKNIKAFREELGVSQQAVAEFMGVKREVVSYWEIGQRRPSVKQLDKLALLYGTNLKNLISGEPTEVDTVFARIRRQADAADMNSLYAFQKIINNYLRMDKLAKT